MAQSEAGSGPVSGGIPAPVPAPPVDANLDRTKKIVEMAIMVVVALVAVYVTLVPNVVYAPVPRNILFLLVALLPAYFVGVRASDNVNINLKWVVAKFTGTMAAVIFLLILLVHLSKPEQQIAVFEVLDEHDQRVRLDREGAIVIQPGSQGVSATKYVDGNTLVLIFPEQLPSVNVAVRKVYDGPEYRGTVGYGGNRTMTLRLGQELKK